MTRAAFRQADLVRALKATAKAGVRAVIHLLKDGTIQIVLANDEPVNSGNNRAQMVEPKREIVL